MNELSLSSDLKQIELEINHHKNIAGQSIWEIGRRLNHVKENDLIHGEFTSWYEKIGLERHFVQRSMKVAKELKSPTLGNLSDTALYLVATLPEEERTKEHVTEKGETKKPDEMTVRELQELKKQLKAKDEQIEIQAKMIEDLNEQEPQIIEKEITIERIPEDYDKIKGGYQALERNKKIYEEQNLELREEIKRLELTLKETPRDDSSREDIKKEIAFLERERIQLAENISCLKNVKNLQNKIEELITEFSAVRYSKELKSLSSNRKMLLSFEESIANAEKWINEIKEDLPNKNIIEGDFKND